MGSVELVYPASRVMSVRESLLGRKIPLDEIPSRIPVGTKRQRPGSVENDRDERWLGACCTDSALPMSRCSRESGTITGRPPPLSLER
jgi:hypothetical protein